MARLNDGHPTTMTFALDADVQFWPKGVKAPGMDAGGAIDTTTMANSTWRTMAAKALKTLTEATLRAAYDPVVYNEILAMLGVNQLITITFPDTSTVAFWAFINIFEPDEAVEGEQPEASINVIPTNQDNSNVETAPVYTAP